MWIKSDAKLYRAEAFDVIEATSDGIHGTTPGAAMPRLLLSTTTEAAATLLNHLSTAMQANSAGVFDLDAELASVVSPPPNPEPKPKPRRKPRKRKAKA